MKTKKMKVKDLKPAPYNPRKISPKALKGLTASIERFGLVEPIIWNKRTGYVVGGHQRLAVLRDKKVEGTTVIVVDMDDIEEKALNVTLNNPHIAGTFDDGLQGILEELDDFDQEMISDLELDNLFCPVEDGDDQWDEMPEFESKDITSQFKITVNFYSEDAIDIFSKLVQQTVTAKTKYINFPKTSEMSRSDEVYK